MSKMWDSNGEGEIQIEKRPNSISLLSERICRGVGKKVLDESFIKVAENEGGLHLTKSRIKRPKTQ